ncbi:conserved hypothetical protein [Burkholderia mallei PRL-20]|uniref:Uncharacterized protein n=1 Tax=Burkholderia mallei (strain NCTC 10229) TaxID=412022 RepID=A2S9A5_BURM9|nr:hypothetical protein BMASAVP1_A0733 [Burkholderia mallei SAVP1]ABN03789.1 hypothetical protein BMA10229_A2566 [Burkholderia mallei NCTC 10229]ABO04830.1 hypothetical protein BMA10247_2047 [Burkholderia mallei NCTC 10247]EDK53768.1 hypothetical protein BMAFMH_0409 [Burkholderia mallei FMH]EDK58737.1 hypothetical protein BMAJHU_0411 [Burkholderia mallei JHU]EDP86385.1 hypothetical protein BMA10399_C0107 [Burkholderia mallei ATCC 10399]EEP88912.1 conserved hypothetical protein [Burkholderia m
MGIRLESVSTRLAMHNHAACAHAALHRDGPRDARTRASRVPRTPRRLVRSPAAGRAHARRPASGTCLA